MPSIVIDSAGGINLLITRTSATSEDPNVVVRHARWSSFESLKNQDSPSLQNLSQLFFAWPHVGNNDYQMMWLAGCKLYAAYTSSESGTWDIYVSVIALDDACADADTDGGGDVTIADVNVFYAAFAEGEPIADRNRDRTVDAMEWLRFFGAYSRAASPP